MAEIVQSLFGITPDMYQQGQQARADQQALQYAQLTPFQQANFAIGRGANMLGGAIGRGLGGEDPELARITMRQQIAGRINPNDPASIKQGIEALAPNDPQGAMMLQREYQRLLESNALIGQRGAAAQASLAQAGREAKQSVPVDIQIANEIASYEDALREIENLPDSPERNRAKNLYNSRLSTLTRLTTKEQKDKYSVFGQSLIDAGLTPGTEPFIKRMNEYLDSKIEGTKKGTGNVTIGGINLDTGVAGKAASKIIGENVANVEQQFSLQTAYKDALGLLDKGIYGGAFGPEKQFIAKYTGVGSPEKVRNTEVFMANIGEIVIPRLVQFGGNDSNEELKYLKDVVAGNQRLEPESMKRILASAEKKVQKNIERLRLQTQAGQTGTPLPITPVSAPTQKPTKRWNPQTRTLETVTGD
jgi:hypothetical protein